MRKLIIVIMALAVVLCSSAFAFATDSAIKAPTVDTVKVDISTKRVSANDANGLKAVLLGMIGDYETVITDYTYNNGNYTSHSIEVEPDYAWIWSAICLIVVMFSVFRAIGGIICK